MLRSVVTIEDTNYFGKRLRADGRGKRMKKSRLILATCFIFASGLLTGCSSSYPTIQIIPSGSANTINIDIGNRYEYVGFEKTDVDKGCEVTIYFENSKSE